MLVDGAVRLIASDLDGTLLGMDGWLTDRTIGVLQAADAAGIEIVAVTGRSYRTAVPRLAEASVVRTAICSNGATVFDLEDERAVLQRLMVNEVVGEVLDALRAAHPEASSSIAPTTSPHSGSAGTSSGGVSDSPGSVITAPPVTPFVSSVSPEAKADTPRPWSVASAFTSATSAVITCDTVWPPLVVAITVTPSMVSETAPPWARRATGTSRRWRASWPGSRTACSSTSGRR